jgi:carbamoylphosphate synthase large subunit
MNFIFGKAFHPLWEEPLRRHGPVLPCMLSECDPILSTVIPHFLEDIECAAKNTVRFPNVFCPEWQTAEIVSNPILFSEWMEKNGFGNCIPKTMIEGEIKFPCIVKEGRPTVGGGIGVHFVENEQEFEILTESLLKIGVRWIAKELIRDRKEYVCHFVAKDGRMEYAITYENEFSTDNYIKRGGMLGKVMNFVPSGIISVIGHMKDTGFCGCNFKFLHGSEHPLKIFEFNPRMGGSLVVSDEHLTRMMQAFKKMNIL